MEEGVSEWEWVGREYEERMRRKQRGGRERVKEGRRRGWRKRNEKEQGRIGAQESGKSGD